MDPIAPRLELSAPPLLRLGLLLLVAAAGCAADTADPTSVGPDDNRRRIGALKEAVEGGQDIAGADDLSGIVRMWSYNSKFDELRQFCTGVMLRSNIVLTAAHCLRAKQESLDYGWPNYEADMSNVLVSTNLANFVAVGTGTPAFAPDGRDVAAFALQNNIPVRAGGQVIESGFNRLLGDTPQPGRTLGVFGYGPTSSDGLTSSICTYVSRNTDQRIKGCVDDPLRLNWGAGDALFNGSELLSVRATSTNGDSGGPTVILYLIGIDSLADLPLVGINSFAYRCLNNPDGSSTCGAVSARIDDIRWWIDNLH